MEKNGGQPADKPARILMARIGEFMNYTTSKDDRKKADWKYARWIDTRLMLAGALTDAEAERGYLFECLVKWEAVLNGLRRDVGKEAGHR